MKIGNDFNLEERQQKRHDENVKALADIGTSLKKVASYVEEMNRTHSEIITLVKNSPKTFRTDGYLFNSFYVSDSQVSDACKLVVSVDGLSYTITLAAGENKVNIPDGADLTLTNTSGNATSFVLFRYNANRS